MANTYTQHRTDSISSINDLKYGIHSVDWICDNNFPGISKLDFNLKNRQN